MLHRGELERQFQLPAFLISTEPMKEILPASKSHTFDLWLFGAHGYSGAGLRRATRAIKRVLMAFQREVKPYSNRKFMAEDDWVGI